MSTNGDQAITLLRSIDASLKQLLREMRAAKPPEMATDQELDGPHGNEIVKFLPRDWNGQDCKGSRMSDCPAEFLDQLADAYAYFARKNDEHDAKTDTGVLKSIYDRRSERRARAWAARLRNGWAPSAETGFPSDAPMADEDLSF